MEGALLRAALVASCLRGAFPPVDLRAVCLVRAMSLTYHLRTQKIIKFVILFFLALVGDWVKGGVINIWPVKPFETVMVIKGYTNKIEFNCIFFATFI